MSSTGLNLKGIKVQTARMVEIYALLQKEIANNEALAVSTEDQQLLRKAIATVANNMRQIQEYFAQHKEENSPDNEETQELEEIVTAVLEWCSSFEKEE